MMTTEGKFKVCVIVSVEREDQINYQLFSETIYARKVPTKILATLLTWIFKLLESYQEEGR